MKYTCTVCGWSDLDEDPREGNHNICPCCACQFGYSDTRPVELLRNHWIENGMKFWAQEVGLYPPPDNWNPVEQLKNIS